MPDYDDKNCDNDGDDDDDDDDGDNDGDNDVDNDGDVDGDNDVDDDDGDVMNPGTLRIDLCIRFKMNVFRPANFNEDGGDA